MLFGTGPSSGSTAGTTAHTYAPYSHVSVTPGPQSQFKSLHPALMNSMLHASNPTGPSQSDLISSLSYHHHGHHIESAGQMTRTASNGEPKFVLGSSESPGSSHRAQAASPSSGGTVQSGNQNEVRNVMLYGVPIVSLVMDGQERLCLAQISNTLLKNFSYNEIHNRRVALGITCVQCTPVQLELLRRAGAMPVSSRRCGMITKREAERLCKSFLAEAEPPKLPETFSFDVYHACAWGCRGSFTPSRYNSSRAKCIKCVYCGLFFSPNKFIFHSHRLPTSKYVQPDAANFNSWRRHIRLVSSPEPPEHVTFAWEDVKAMFNGGSRKRAMTTTLNSFTKNQESHSKANAASKQALKYKYSDDNSGLEDSDDYCSLDAPPGKKPSGNDSEGNSQQEEEPSPHSTSHLPYHSFAQINSKSIFENHFKKAFEVSSLIGDNSGQQQAPKSGEGKEQQQQQLRSPARSSPLSIKSTAEPAEIHKSAEVLNSSSSFSPIESYLESTKSALPPVKPTLQPIVPPTGPTYLGQHSGNEHQQQQVLMASYNGLFGSHPANPFNRQPQLTDPRMAGAHPAILSTLLNGVPESAASQQLRSGLLSSNYMQMGVPAMMTPTANSSTSDLTSPTLLSSHSSPAGAQADFRHNLAEFMWSMASKAGPPPYNFFWPHAGVHPAISHPQMSNSIGGGASTLPLGTSQSSSSSSTPTLSPNQMPPGSEGQLSEPASGNLMGFKSANADEIRKALLLNTNHLLHQQRNAAASHFSPLHASTAGMPFLPNLIGHNLRLIPPNGAHNPAMSPNYLLNKENSEAECVQNRAKSPDPVASHQSSSLPVVPAPLFPFRSAFTSPVAGSTAMDRFSSEAFLRNQLLFDAYHSGGSSSLSGRSLFHPNLFSEKQRFDDSNSDSGADKTIDVIGDDSDPHSMFKSMYQPIGYPKRASSNGSSKFARRNLKRSLDSDSKSGNKKTASFKVKSPRKKGNENLLVLDADRQKTLFSLESTNKRLSTPESEPPAPPVLLSSKQPGDCTKDGSKDEESVPMEQCNIADEMSCVVEGRSATRSPLEICSKPSSPLELNPTPNEDAFPLAAHTSTPTPSVSASSGKMFLLLNDSAPSQPSPGGQALQLVS